MSTGENKASGGSKPKNLTVFSGLRDRIISSENGFSRWRVILGVLVLRRSLESSMS